MTRTDPWISAEEAARLLAVSRATLYAYVSRGYVRSQPTPGASRHRRYSRDDVERMRRRTEERRDPRKVAARTLDWGIPVLESSITFIDGDALYYRGHNAIALAASRSVSEVAALIWTGQFDASFLAAAPAPATTASRIDPELSFVARAQSALAAAAAHDPLAFDVRAGSVARTGLRILQLVTRAAVARDDMAGSVDATLARHWRVAAKGADLLRQTIVLCADHELNVSSFTARCVASAGSHPYAVVIAGLAALEGTRHGGVGARVEAMLASMRNTRQLTAALSQRLRRGETIDGFGHPLYPHGDPRAATLIRLLSERHPRSPELAFVLEFADAAHAVLRERPNVDFALAALARVLRLPPEAPLSLFAIGRTIGWIGHAIEQYGTGQLIRPRATYAGPLPLEMESPRESRSGRGS